MHISNKKARPEKWTAMLLSAKLFHFLCFLIFIVVCFVGWRVSKKFGIVTLDQIIFHVVAPKEGIDKQLMTWAFRYAVAVVLIICIYAYIIFFGVFRKGLIKRILSHPGWNVSLGMAFLAVTIVCAQVKYDMFSFFFEEESPFIQDNYIACRPDETAFPIKRNAVILILESMEGSYCDEAFFNQALIPRLSSIRKENMGFFCQRQLHGTGWTIAGLTSYFFGMPLLLFKNQGNILFEKYMQHALSIFEILEHHGYSIEYVLSGAAAFAGTDTLFETHSHAIIQDSKFFEEAEGKKYDSYWGVPDSHAYAWAKHRYQCLSEDAKPFALIVQTLDTHPYEGRLEPYDDHGRGFVDVLNAADRMAADFVEWIQEQPNAANTTIVILGDHLTGKNPLYSQLMRYGEKRSIYNAFINSCKTTDNKYRLCSSLDMAPTILESLGCELPKHGLGLGVSLFSGSKTLVERFGEKEVNAMLKKKSSFYKKLFIRKTLQE